MADARISIQGSLSKGWAAKRLGVRFGRDYYFDVGKRHQIDRRCNQYAADELGDLDIFYTESNLGRFEYFSQEQVLIGGIQPNMLLGMLIGAEFIANDSMDADISPTPLKDKPLDRLPSPQSLLEHEMIKLFDRQIAEIKAEGRLVPIPPFFWDASGRATIHGPLTTAQKFLGEDFFIDLISEPEKAVKILDWISECFIVLCEHFSKAGDLPISSVHIGECSACLLRGELFARFVAPFASKIAKALGPLRLHSCGPSTHLLDSMQKIDELACLDLGGETSIAKTREIFGQDFPVDIAPLPVDFSADSPGPILEWAKKILKENAGGKLKILYHLEPDYNLETVRALSKFVKNNR